MAEEGTGSRRDLRVLRSKRDASRYQILVEIADRQPAVSQQEIADAVGITAQAVSDYVQDLVERGYVEKHGRGRYEVTKEGVDWLISRTDDLQAYADYVAEEVIGQVDVDTAIATGDVAEGDRVTLSMREGVLHATPGATGSATAVAVTGAVAGQDVGVTDFEGLLEYDPGTVTVVALPEVREGGSRAVDPERVVDLHESHDRLAVAGTEAFAAAARAGLDPDVQFGTAEAVSEAATLGLDVLLLSVTTRLSTHTDRLRENGVSYEVVDAR
ncbi:MAG: MarR family transcriptional regulator [Haloarculaceae archaeon]